MSGVAFRHHRSISRDSEGSRHPRSPSPPSQIYHPSILPRSVPTPALVESVAGGAHYSGVKVDSDAVLKHRRSSTYRPHTELKHSHHIVLDDLTELFCCRPTLEIFERSWNKDAEFDDPLSKCKGYNEYAAQWFAMPKVFSKSEEISRRVMSSTDNPNQLIYHLRQEYTLRYFNRKKLKESIVVVDMDESDKIVRLIDRWDGKDLPTRFGASLLRSLNGKITPWFVNFPKPSA